jgi:hypothetical protein
MAMMDDPIENLYWRDEILQVMYWFRGEGLGETVTPRELVTFLGTTEELIQRHIDRLVDEGYAVRQEDPAPARYRLSEQGVKEGGRRFAEEFRGLTGQAHGECSDPDCACRTMGRDACEARSNPSAHFHDDH